MPQMMTPDTAHDLYPSRIDDAAGLSDRAEPVVRGTVDDGPLSAEQLERFDDDGFLTLEGVLSSEECDEVLDEMSRLASIPDVRESDRTVLELETDEVRSVFEVHLLSEAIKGLIKSERVTGPARQLLGSEIYIHQSRVNFKPGFRGKEFYWHSDFETWHTEDGMPTMRAVSVSIALTDNYEQNGPLLLIPGSHRHYVKTVGETPDDHYKQSLVRQEIGVPDDESVEELARIGGEIVSSTGPRGSATIFDCNTMHGSNSNITPLPRSNLFIVCNSVENTLVEPFAGTQPRPEFIAARDFTPIPEL